MEPTAILDFEEPDEREEPDGWWALARCNDGTGNMTGLFFSDDLFDIGRAKAICAKCPVRATCLDAAIARVEPWGVWGGELLSNGRIVTGKRPRGRPPKNPRPEVTITELGEVIEVKKTA